MKTLIQIIREVLIILILLFATIITFFAKMLMRHKKGIVLILTVEILMIIAFFGGTIFQAIKDEHENFGIRRIFSEAQYRILKEKKKKFFLVEDSLKPKPEFRAGKLRFHSEQKGEQANNQEPSLITFANLSENNLVTIMPQGMPWITIPPRGVAVFEKITKGNMMIGVGITEAGKSRPSVPSWRYAFWNK